jgi:transposase
MHATTIGLDIAKTVFQVHGEDASGKIVLQKRMGRAKMEKFFAEYPAAVIGIEACGSAHYWARTLQKLGHEVRLIPAAYVKPFVKRNKTDARDAAAICAALGRPDMRFVPVKTVEQQGSRGVERSRELLTKQHTQLVNSVRGQMAKFGIIAPQGKAGFAALKQLIAQQDQRIPELLMQTFKFLVAQAEQIENILAQLDKKIEAAVKADSQMQRLCSIPGIGPLTAYAIVAAIGDGRQFNTARDFAAWVGLTPKENSSANARRQSGISRRGDSRLRKLLTLGASTIMKLAKTKPERATVWQSGILARRPVKVSVVAQAAKNARIAWVVLTSGQAYRSPVAPVTP